MHEKSNVPAKMQRNSRPEARVPAVAHIMEIQVRVSSIAPAVLCAMQYRFRRSQSHSCAALDQEAKEAGEKNSTEEEEEEEENEKGTYGYLVNGLSIAARSTRAEQSCCRLQYRLHGRRKNSCIT